MKVKKLVARIWAIWATMFIGFIPVSLETLANEMIETNYIEGGYLLIEPKADDIGWEYKVVGNKKYRRQYNYTKREWIGEWVFFCYV